MGEGRAKTETRSPEATSQAGEDGGEEMTKQKDLFYILQDVRFGELSEKEAILKLQELGVVIKVEKELPSWPDDVAGTRDYKTGWSVGLAIARDKLGYVAVEPLIEVKK